MRRAFSISVYEPDLPIIQAVADAHGMTRSEVLRWLVTTEAQRLGLVEKMGLAPTVRLQVA